MIFLGGSADAVARATAVAFGDTRKRAVPSLRTSARARAACQCKTIGPLPCSGLTLDTLPQQAERLISVADLGMAKIFISYRRSDAAGHAGRLYDGLVREYGADQVFIDRVNIDPGVKFADLITREATQSDALLVVIGRHWTDMKDKTGRRRLDDRGDFVRREVESGLKRSRRTIPVLVDGAAMPSDDQLPDTLKPLSAQNALELSDSRWNYDLARLTKVLGPVFGLPQQFPFEPRMMLIPEGDFVMGADSAKDRYADTLEQPQHTVQLHDYYISKLPITVAQFGFFLKDNPAAQTQAALRHRSSLGAGLRTAESLCAYVTFNEAIDYCLWLSDKMGRLYHLPNEAEWEKAVRGTDGRIYPWGNSWPQQQKGASAAFRGASPFGLLYAVGGHEWAWTERAYKDVVKQLEPEGLLDRLRFWDSRQREVSEVVSNYPYNPEKFTDRIWRQLFSMGRGGSGLNRHRHESTLRGGGQWNEAQARCTARAFPSAISLSRAGFRVALSRHQVSLPG